jgi:hypothetical protein
VLAILAAAAALARQNCAEVGGGAYPGLLARIRNGRVSVLVAGISICD